MWMFSVQGLGVRLRALEFGVRLGASGFKVPN